MWQRSHSDIDEPPAPPPPLPQVRSGGGVSSLGSSAAAAGGSSGLTKGSSIEDASFASLEAYVLGQAGPLTAVYNASAALAIRYREQAQLLLDHGAALRSLGSTEGGAYGASLSGVGLSTWAASTAAYEQAVQETELWVERLADHVRGLRATRELLEERVREGGGPRVSVGGRGGRARGAGAGAVDVLSTVVCRCRSRRWFGSGGGSVAGAACPEKSSQPTLAPRRPPHARRPPHPAHAAGARVGRAGVSARRL